jgi:hypothetical protein
MAQGASAVPVDTVAGFTAGMLTYLRHPAGAGQYQFVTAVGADTVTVDGAAAITYPAGSGLYAIDERSYDVDTTIPGQPRLMLTVDRGDPQVFAVGVSDLQIRYVLNRNCDPCDVEDAPDPTDTATWRLVNDVLLTATAETVGTVRPEDEATITQTSRAKPRNLLP